MLDQKRIQELHTTASALVALGKGILAADESAPTIKKRFVSIGADSTEENRRSYREMLFTTKGVGEFISGVILFDETIRQSTSDGTGFPEVLRAQGIIPGIKVDEGKDPLTQSPQEHITKGLDGLAERLREYNELGARFTKWRAVIIIKEGLPSEEAIGLNAERLASFAAISQEAGMVPIVEPEVLMDGDHTIERCAEVTLKTLKRVYEKLDDAKVVLAGTLLKPNMVLSGKDAERQATSQEVAAATLRVLKQAVPSEVPGIVFLSGGQSDVLATVHLNEMNKTSGHPWELSFSYGRALQAPALKAWGGKAENVPAAQKVLYRRAKLNSTARFGTYTEAMEDA